MLSVQKNKKITRTVPILKSNYTVFSLIFFMIDVKNFLEGGQARVGMNFFFTYYYIILSM